jgi:hypothetical protein
MCTAKNQEIFYKLNFHIFPPSEILSANLLPFKLSFPDCIEHKSFLGAGNPRTATANTPPIQDFRNVALCQSVGSYSCLDDSSFSSSRLCLFFGLFDPEKRLLWSFEMSVIISSRQAKAILLQA